MEKHIMKSLSISSLSIISIFLGIAGAYASHYQNGDIEVLPQNGHSSINSKGNNLISSKSQSGINLNIFADQDPFDLDELYQQNFVKEQFDKAALYCIAAAKQGHSENQNYLLSIYPQALQTLDTNDREELSSVHRLVMERLKEQHTHFKLFKDEKVVLPKSNPPFQYGSFK
jgi:hypothetical protein